MGIALHQGEPEFAIVKTYYDAAGREPTRRGDLAISSTDSFTPNFLDLVKMLVAKKETHVVIVAHGYESGLLMPITAKNAAATNDPDSADTPVIKDLSTMVDEYPNYSDKVSKFAQGYSVMEDDVKDLIKQCYTVRKDVNNCVAVHIRGCKIGKNDENLLAIRKLFDSLVVSAAKCPMLYAPFTPNWSRPRDQNVDTWKTANKPNTRRREFEDKKAGRSLLVMDVNYTGSTSSTQGVIKHADDLPKWASVIYDNNTHGKLHSMEIAAMWSDTSFFLPHESGYVDQIMASRDG
jgi:hypothetical protein